jgi:hypothetical protein
LHRSSRQPSVLKRPRGCGDAAGAELGSHPLDLPRLPGRTFRRGPSKCFAFFRMSWVSQLLPANWVTAIIGARGPLPVPAMIRWWHLESLSVLDRGRPVRKDRFSTASTRKADDNGSERSLNTLNHCFVSNLQSIEAKRCGCEKWLLEPKM